MQRTSCKEHAHVVFPPSRALLLGGWPATREVRARVHACLDAVRRERERERAARCMYDRYDGTQPIRAVHRACTGVREPLRAIIMAAVDTPSLSPVSNASLERTNERSQLRSLAIIIFSAARKDARAHENRTRPEISVHTRARETRATVSIV